MKANPKVAGDYWKIADTKNFGMDKKEELRQIEENLPVKI